MIDEEHPRPVGQAAMDLHAVVMHLDRPALGIDARDQPLRARHGEVAGDRGVMGDHVHVRLKADIGRHGLGDGLAAARDRRAAMDFVDLHDRGLGVVHCRRGFDILRVERARARDCRARERERP